jgi:hypothetical protein
MLKHCAASRKRRLSALPNVGPLYTTSKFLALQGAPYVYNISRLRVKSLLPGQEDCVFFSGHLNLHAKPETGIPYRGKKL